MITLMKLELRRNKIRTYLISAVIISITMLGFFYLFAYAPMLEPDDKDMKIFSGYSNLIPLSGVLNMAAFCVLSAVMYSKIIIEDYSGKRPILLFSYPVSRKKIMLSKLSVVCIFTAVSMITSSLIIFTLFGLTETFLHMVNEAFTLSIVLQAAETTVLMSLTAAGISMMSAAIGFIKKSVPATIISAVLIASLMCNIVANTAKSRMAIYLFAAVMILIGVISTMLLMSKAEAMEVE